MSTEFKSNRKTHGLKGVQSGVEGWCESVTMPTYEVGAPEVLPMFLENRVYQGSSGRVYPLQMIDKVATAPKDRPYEALHLENGSLYVMVLPEIGGRIHIGFDKLSNYDFFYRQDVIKPALVGLAGPWISGGVEFNWPQHHRPSTFMPCAWFLEERSDGSKIFWLSEHEPMNRMKGMHGVCVKPDSNLLELKVRLYNRTPFRHTFLWWANLAARVHEKYQSFFPPDVNFVADHAKRAISHFPSCRDSYYGVRYHERALNGVARDEMPSCFLPDPTLSPDRLDWYANIPVPTSYMIVDTDFDFFGGYDHLEDTGFVHVADRSIAPGKKQWTWGNHEFGYSWDRNLTETGGPYVELMAGVFTDNQPDFSFISPYETKSFSQYWYPIRKIGPAHNATKLAAVSIHGNRVGVCPSQTFKAAKIIIDLPDGREVRIVNLTPSDPFIETFQVEPNAVYVHSSNGDALVSFDRSTLNSKPSPEPAEEPPVATEIPSVDELYQTGLHLEQYRHATRSPEVYWEEALRRDPLDARCNLAMAKRRLAQGVLDEAEEYVKQALKRLVARNPNPETGEAHYLLGLILRYRGRFQEARNAFGKATWNYEYRAAANIHLAQLSVRDRGFERALSHLQEAKLGVADANIIGCLKALVHRSLGNHVEAQQAIQEVLSTDPLDIWALYEGSLLDPGMKSRWIDAMQNDVQNFLDLAFEYRQCGLDEEAEALLRSTSLSHPVKSLLLGERASSAEHSTGLFPNRLEEMLLLESAIQVDKEDAVAQALLGTLYYDRRRYPEAIARWEDAVEANPDDFISLRNLGIAYFNYLKAPEAAQNAYLRALSKAPNNSRILFEYDQLSKRLGLAPSERLQLLTSKLDLVRERDDLSLELSALYNQTGQPDLALQLLASRTFTPWEGGEGIALSQFTRASILCGRTASPSQRIQLLQEALTPPFNLGESRHLLANASDLWVELGDALLQSGNTEEARHWYSRAADFRGDFQNMSVRHFSEMTYFKAVALKRLERQADADKLLEELRSYSFELEATEAKIDYFATSLPTMLLFHDSIKELQVTTALFLRAQAEIGLERLGSGIELLDQVLERDPNHSLAQDLKTTISQLSTSVS